LSGWRGARPLPSDAYREHPESIVGIVIVVLEIVATLIGGAVVTLLR
jgi:hypothetical protein